MLRRVLFSLASSLLFTCAAECWADVHVVRALLSNGENQMAIEAARLEGPNNPELEHLAALAMIRLANQRNIADPEAELWLPGELEEIERLLKSAIDADYGPAMFDYAYVMAIGADELSDASLALLAQSARNGTALAAIALYNTYCSGAEIPTSISEVEAMVTSVSNMPMDIDTDPDFFSIFNNSDDNEIAYSAKRSLAQNLATGSCGRKDKLEAKRIYDSLIDGPDQFWIEMELGNIVNWFRGDGPYYTEVRFPIQKDESEAFYWLSYKVQSGRASYTDYNELTQAFISGTGTPRNFRKAIAAMAACYLEEKLDDGIWCRSFEIYDTAESLLTDSAAAGSLLASSEIQYLQELLGTIASEEAAKGEFLSWYYAERLGDFYYDGSFGAPDFQKALDWYRLAAKAGSIKSQFRTGLMYSTGEGTPKNGSEAVRFFEMAAANGDSASAYNLAWLYAYSGLVAKDDVEGTKWYRRAAELGDLDSVAALGQRISDGVGALENDLEAIRWLTVAAEAGHKTAQSNLAIMYANGEGVDKDLVVAYKWANLAGSSGADVTDIKSWLTLRMSREEVARAQSLSALWKPTEFTELSFSNVASAEGRKAAPKSDPLTMEIQTGLTELGFLRGPIDGYWGPVTRAAIEAFQRSYGVAVDGKVSPQLATQIGRALSATPGMESRPLDNSAETATGSGFVISTAGHVVTNAHVVTGCRRLKLDNGELLTMQAYDPTADLALLQSSTLATVRPLALRRGTSLQVAEQVAVAGYPLTGIVSPDLNVTLGNVSALSGPDGNNSLIQITAPVQPGNSGGPILDEAGNVVGVVVSKLDAIAVASVTGDIPQNVNFGISLNALRAFLDEQGVRYSSSISGTALRSTQVVEQARSSIVRIQCHYH